MRINKIMNSLSKRKSIKKLKLDFKMKMIIILAKGIKRITKTQLIKVRTKFFNQQTAYQLIKDSKSIQSPKNRAKKIQEFI